MYIWIVGISGKIRFNCSALRYLLGRYCNQAFNLIAFNAEIGTFNKGVYMNANAIPQSSLNISNYQNLM